MMARLIPVVSSESLQLKSSQHVNLLMASLKYIVDTNDTLARREMTDFAAEIFKRPILIQADNKKLSRLEFENSFNKALQIDFSPEKLSNNTIYNMALVLCKCFNFVVTTNPFLLKWLDQILEASKKNIRSLPDLIDWWNDKGQNISITFPDNLDAVRILTVHKSKGLEYPVVILPEFTEAPKNNSTRYVWVSPDKEWLKPVSSCILPVRKSLLHTEFYEIWEEEVRNRALDIINIMYVSTTRASDRLHIIASESKISSNIQAENSFNLLKSFLENQSQDEPQSHYEFGDPKTGNREQHTDAGESFFDASNLLHTAVVDRKLHVRITPERFIESSRLMRMERGSLLHRLMSISTSKTDIANNVKHFVAAGLITSTESEEIKKHCESVFDLDALKPYLTDDWIAINERAILTNDGSLIPDRVLLQKDTRNAVVVDFKTGGINASYSQQLEKYAAAIEGLGYNVLEKLLVYIDEGKAVAVKE
jgi:ATP-dependent exoDNAse (exonuclease V) beta subunit